MTMNPALHYQLAAEHIADIHRRAGRARTTRSRSPRRQLRITEAVRTRLAFLLVQIGLHLLRSRFASTPAGNSRTPWATGVDLQRNRNAR
jgi:hypothetical protein